DQALRIKELETEVARKDYALAAVEQGQKLSHEYKKSLSEPFHMAIQAGKLYLMYDKLFEKEYPYIEKIASGYHHSVVDLLKVHPDPAPFEGTSTPTISKALGASYAPPLQKKT
ncbi:hypothetical protein Tco_0828455, partial [Tanacetum coccineum]